MIGSSGTSSSGSLRTSDNEYLIMMAPHLEMVKLTPLMKLTRGKPEMIIGLIDGPVLMNHPDLARENIREIPGKLSGACAQANSAACLHGTFVAGILSANRDSRAPAICPDCTLLVRPIFAESDSTNGGIPSASPDELATAIVDCIDAGARIFNRSAALAPPSSKGERKLQDAFDYAARSEVIAVAAAGNQGTVGSSAITRHPWVIPVAACNSQGRPLTESNLGGSIGKQGLSAPGENVTSLGSNGKAQTFGGTSAAAPFVTGTIALLWSEFARANANQIRLAVTQALSRRRRAISPPLLNAWAAYQALLNSSL